MWSQEMNLGQPHTRQVSFSLYYHSNPLENLNHELYTCLVLGLQAYRKRSEKFSKKNNYITCNGLHMAKPERLRKLEQNPFLVALSTY